VLLHIIIVFCGIVLIHRTVTFVPTYSGFKYDSLALTSSVLTFLVIVLSIQTKLGIKVSILFERVGDLWNGTDSSIDREESKGKVRVKQPLSKHAPSRADNMDSASMQNDLFPPAPVAQSRQQSSAPLIQDFGPVAANSLIGSAFGSLF